MLLYTALRLVLYSTVNYTGQRVMLPGVSTETCDNTHGYHDSLQLKSGEKTVEDKHTTNLHGQFWSKHFTFSYSFNKTLRRITRSATMYNFVLLFKSDLFPFALH